MNDLDFIDTDDQSVIESDSDKSTTPEEERISEHTNGRDGDVTVNASDSEMTVNNNEGSETANEEAEGLMEIPENEKVGLGVYISLSEKYKSLNKAGKEKMKKDEDEKWVLLEGK